MPSPWQIIRKNPREIETDPVLRIYGGALAFLHLLSFYHWQFFRPLASLLDPRRDPLCWPFFEDCHAYRLLEPATIRLVLWHYLALALVAIALFAARRLTTAAYVALLLLQFFHALVLIQDVRLRLNQHYMATWVTLAFLFLPSKRRLVRYLIVGFYFWAGALKLDWEWLSGAALYGKPLGVPPALIPLACAYVVVLEMVIVFGLLARNPWIFWASFGQFLLFHVVSTGVVGLYYPTLMIAILSIFPLARLFGAEEERPSLLRLADGREPWTSYAVLMVFAFLQVLPYLFPGDSAITGEGRLFALHMFDARVVCEASATLRSRDAQARTVVLQPRLAQRIRCDPLVYFNLAHALCRKLRREPGFDDLDLLLRSRRSSEPELRPVISLTNFCRQKPSYDLWRPNPWILRG